jgi:hypothetical protein
MADLYQITSGLGDAYLAGQKFGLDRDKLQADTAYTQANTQRVQGLVQSEDAQRARDAKMYAGLDEAYAADPTRGMQPQGMPAPTDRAQPAMPAQTDGTQPAMPAQTDGTQPAMPASAGITAPAQFSRGDQQRRLARVYGAAGQSEKANKAAIDAETFDKQDIYNYGASITGDPAKLDAALRMLNKKDPELTVARGKDGIYHMTLVSPDGTAYPRDLSDAELKHLFGAQALMEAGYVSDALPLFAKVDARLAATIHTRNAAQMGIGTFENKARIDAQNSDAKTTMADAATARAQAAQMRAEAAGMKVPKEIPPELNARHNSLVERLSEETDPAERKKIVTQINANETLIANALGKPRGLPGEKEAKPVSEADMQAYVDYRASKDPEFKRLDFSKQRAVAQADLGGKPPPKSATDLAIEAAASGGGQPALPSRPQGLPPQNTGAVYGTAEDTKARLRAHLARTGSAGMPLVAPTIGRYNAPREGN